MKPVISNPPSATITATRHGRPWLARLPPGLFSIVFGLLGLAGTWRRMATFDLEVSGVVAMALLHLAKQPQFEAMTNKRLDASIPKSIRAQL